MVTALKLSGNMMCERSSDYSCICIANLHHHPVSALLSGYQLSAEPAWDYCI